MKYSFQFYFHWKRLHLGTNCNSCIYRDPVEEWCGTNISSGMTRCTSNVWNKRNNSNLCPQTTLNNKKLLIWIFNKSKPCLALLHRAKADRLNRHYMYSESYFPILRYIMLMEVQLLVHMIEYIVHSILFFCLPS